MIRDWLNKNHVFFAILCCLFAAIGLLMFLDYFNLEKIEFFNRNGFLFDYTWKGRLYLLFFAWVFVLESFLALKPSSNTLFGRPRKKVWAVAAIACALIPLIYVISINFLGLDQAVINLGSFVRLDFWKANWAYWENSLMGDWPMAVEYVVFAVSIISAIVFAYGKAGLKSFSISASLITGVAVVYMIDTLYPSGAFKPFEALALPTAAFAAVILEAMGIPFMMIYAPGPTSTPAISVTVQGAMVPTGIAWPCAGIQSLFLFAVIIMLIFKRSNISRFRKAVYFVVGAVGTYLANVGRVVTYFVVLLNQGQEAASVFHNVYGELFFFSWMLLYLLAIVSIQRYGLAEKAKAFVFRRRS